jgi:hypothetical protein
MSEKDETTKNAPVQKCCDCLSAKVFRETSGNTGRYLLKVKCVKGHWRVGRKHGHCDLHRVMARRRHRCPDFESMSENEEDRKQYLADLAMDLPDERILYEPNGEPVDITEVAGCRTAM